MAGSSITHTVVKKISAATATAAADTVATEEPLEIRLEYMAAGRRISKSISVTMRTPGSDEELALGFLYTEGIIKTTGEVIAITHAAADNENVIVVVLAGDVQPDISKLERNFYTTSSCGVCGKASIEAVRVACNILDTKDNITVTASVFYLLPDTLRKVQEVFAYTGGLHGGALFDLKGDLLLSREDVGRHNALDKLIGAALQKEMLPMDKHILLLSGRASFELVQKAAMAGIKIVAAVGAPSSLAVQMAEEWGMTLIGFLRGERFNIYSGAQRIVI